MRNLTLGLALITAGQILSVNAEPRKQSLQPGPIDSSLVESAQQLGKAFAMVAAHVQPTVVSVYSEKIVQLRQPQFQSPFGDDFFRQFFGDDFQNQPEVPRAQPQPYRLPQRGMGSGILIDKEGRILTNYHVVRDVDEIKVQLADKRIFQAEIVGSDPPSDVAVIRIKGKVPDDLPTAELGDSDAVGVGYLVMAIGAPFGYAQTVTTGIISAKDRSGVGINAYEDFLQTDAAINPGNSGGPLVNMRGEVIGLDSAIATRIGQSAGVGFAIPINMIKSILPTLIKGGTVTRGLLGVLIQDVTPELAKQFRLQSSGGALVSQVNPDSPAEKAGIQVGDIILQYDSVDIRDTAHLRNLVAATAPGKKTKLTVLRDGKKETVTATIGTLTSTELAATKPSEGDATILDKLGLSLQTLTSDLAKELGYENRKGALVTEVAQGSLASLAGLQEGDLIVEVNHQKIASVEDMQKALGKASEEEPVLLLVKRKEASLFLLLKLQ